MRTVQFLIAIATVLAGAAIPTLAQAPGKVQLKPDVEEFIGKMVEQHQFEEAALRQVFAQLKLHDGVVKAISAPSTAKPWHEFRNIFVTPTRISGGLEFWQQHADLLVRARDIYGVPEEIIVSIIGVETIYGRRLGSFRVVDALYTLGFEMTQSGFRSALRRLRTERPRVRSGSASMSTEFWSGLATEPAAFTATTSGGSLYDVEALSRLLMASRRTDLEDLRR